MRAWDCWGSMDDEEPVCPAAFARHGIAIRTPEASDRGWVDKGIFNELCQGILEDSSRAVRGVNYFCRQI